MTEHPPPGTGWLHGTQLQPRDIARLREAEQRAEKAEAEVEKLGQRMYEECVPKNEANERIAHEQEQMRALCLEQLAENRAHAEAWRKYAEKLREVCARIRVLCAEGHADDLVAVTADAALSLPAPEGDQ